MLLSDLFYSADTNVDIKNKLQKSLLDYFADLKQTDKQQYKKIMKDIYTDIHGQHFDMHLANKAVSKMENVDGTTGAHWTFDQINNIINQNNIKSHKYNNYDFYYVVNMLYSDYQTVLGNDINVYIKLTKAWLDDPDVGEGKAFRYYFDVVRA